MPHVIPGQNSNAKTVKAPTQAKDDDGGKDGPSRKVTQAGYGNPKAGFNGGKGF